VNCSVIKKADRVGRIPAADGSTLFLDEIGNLPLHLQPKLLTALEQRQVTPVGSNIPVPVDARVICATNLSRDQLADEKQFRPDLLFRLNTVEIHVPPLRQRREDIPMLAEYFLSLYSQKYDRVGKPFAASAMAALIGYDWPGNVRALRHAIERAVILSRGDEYSCDDLALAFNAVQTNSESTPERVTASHDADDLNLARIEKQTIDRALKKHAWNVSLTAKELGLTRASLYRRMERHGL
jgi:DNA-binding NtrC family response regulator